MKNLINDYYTNKLIGRVDFIEKAKVLITEYLKTAFKYEYMHCTIKNYSDIQIKDFKFENDIISFKYYLYSPEYLAISDIININVDSFENYESNMRNEWIIKQCNIYEKRITNLQEKLEKEKQLYNTFKKEYNVN